MKIGMLWYSNDPKTDLTAKVKQAADYYAEKYGKVPSLVYVHPTMLPSGSAKAENVEIRTHRSILPNHFWVGVGEV